LKKGETERFDTKNRVILIMGKAEREVTSSFNVHVLTTAGKELFKSLESISNDLYARDVAEDIFNENQHIINVKIHKILFRDKGKTTIERIPMQEWE
jgi:hypothetical protein